MQTTRDPAKIKRWVERRSGHALQIADSDQVGIGFPGFVMEEGAHPITWDVFFDIFDSNGLTFSYEETRPDGTMSHIYSIS